MAILDLDFSQSKNDLVPEGDYSVVVEKVEVRPAGPNSTTGAPNLNWTFQITEGDFKGRKVFLNTNLAPQSLWNLRSMLEGLGLWQEGLKFVTDDASNYLVQPQLAGVPAVATVAHSEYPKGTMRAGVTALKGRNGASPNGGGPQFR